MILILFHSKTAQASPKNPKKRVPKIKNKNNYNLHNKNNPHRVLPAQSDWTKIQDGVLESSEYWAIKLKFDEPDSETISEDRLNYSVKNFGNRNEKFEKNRVKHPNKSKLKNDNIDSHNSRNNYNNNKGNSNINSNSNNNKNTRESEIKRSTRKKSKLLNFNYDLNDFSFLKDKSTLSTTIKENEKRSKNRSKIDHELDLLADQVAIEHNLVNLGQIGELKGHYLFKKLPDPEIEVLKSLKNLAVNSKNSSNLNFIDSTAKNLFHQINSKFSLYKNSKSAFQYLMNKQLNLHPRIEWHSPQILLKRNKRNKLSKSTIRIGQNIQKNIRNLQDNLNKLKPNQDLPLRLGLIIC